MQVSRRQTGRRCDAGGAGGGGLGRGLGRGVGVCRFVVFVVDAERGPAGLPVRQTRALEQRVDLRLGGVGDGDARGERGVSRRCHDAGGDPRGEHGKHPAPLARETRRGGATARVRDERVSFLRGDLLVGRREPGDARGRRASSARGSLEPTRLEHVRRGRGLERAGVARGVGEEGLDERVDHRRLAASLDTRDDDASGGGGGWHRGARGGI